MLEKLTFAYVTKKDTCFKETKDLSSNFQVRVNDPYPESSSLHTYNPFSYHPA